MKNEYRQLIYNTGKRELKDWLIQEDFFDSRYTGKCEAIFCQGNGYLGLRNALEERYPFEKRNLFIAGTFNKFHPEEVTELPNFPDVTNMNIFINEKNFSLLEGRIYDYKRTMNLKNGEVTRTVDWESMTGERIRFNFRRFVSMFDKHVIAERVEIEPVSENILIKIISGIDGTVTNSGVQHWVEGEKRIYENRYLELLSGTTQSNVFSAMYTAHKYYLNDKEAEPELLPVMSRRCIQMCISQRVQKGQKFILEKFSSVHTSRDQEYAVKNSKSVIPLVRNDGKRNIKKLYEMGYTKLFEESSRMWKKLWCNHDVIIQSEDSFDQLAIRFAVYHMNIMVKKDDNRVGIGAKGLTGEGYKGHSFWDTEIFLFPYYLLTQPLTAKTLLEYRYKNLYGARNKAKEYGYEGAMYPWEAAWIEDGEVTPLYGFADIVTGEPIKYWTGILEQHITADIAYAVWQYYEVTKDEQFMINCGYEIIFETACFWNSRLEWNEDKKRYEINYVIGPDEYKECINNNAYTNYLAAFNMEIALRLAEELNGNVSNSKIYNILVQEMELEKLVKDIKEKLPLLYLPQPNKNNKLIEQFEGYFKLKHMDISTYKKSEKVLTIYNDLSQEQINHYQISKQGDLIVLFFLLPQLFDKETMDKNFTFYEERTLHDSSLSMSTHSVLACELGRIKEACSFYKSACRVDLGTDMKSSEEGIHSAAMGGIWEAAVMGFGGVKIMEGSLHISPSLPKEWGQLRFRLVFRKAVLEIIVEKEEITVINHGETEEIFLRGIKTVIEGGAVCNTKQSYLI